jgi:hypothetical protein
MVVATTALFVALGGTGYAAFSLPKSSVGTKQLKNSAVTTKKIKNGAVTAKKLNMAGFTAPNARHANTADSARTASSADNANHASNADSATSAQPVAFAHWDAVGASAMDNAKNMTITSAGPPLTYCLSNIPFTPRGGQVTMDAAGFGGDYPARFGLGKPTACPAGTQAYVYIQQAGTSGTTDDSFFVTVYG